MESNSKPGKIHMSSSANHYLLEANEGFVTEPRGQVLIKGKGGWFNYQRIQMFVGMMDTYWLLGRGQSSDNLFDRIPSTPSTDRLTDEHEPNVTSMPHDSAAVPLYADYLEYTKAGN